MTPTELLSEIDRILEDSKTALLATVDSQGRPSLRWMTPRRIKVRPAYLYCASEVATRKVEEIRSNPVVAWTIQRPTLSEVITVSGRAAVLEEPIILQEFLEAVGKDLFMVWRLHPAQERPRLVVIETVLETATRLDSLTGKTQTFTFGS